MRRLLPFLFVATLWPATPSSAAVPATTWICPPRGPSACAVAVPVVTVPPYGAAIHATLTPRRHPLGMCFVVTTDEPRTVIGRMAPFSSVCRVVMPLLPTNPARQFVVLQRAWHDARHAQPKMHIVVQGLGRGADLAAALLRRDIAPIRTAHHFVEQVQLIDTMVLVPTVRHSRDALGGEPICRFRTQPHCVLIANPFAQTPPAHSPFVGRPGLHSVCVNPVFVNQKDGPLTVWFGASPVVTYPNRFRAVCAGPPSRRFLLINQVNDFGPILGRNSRPTLPATQGDPKGLHALAWNLLAGNLAAAAQTAFVSQSLRK